MNQTNHYRAYLFLLVTTLCFGMNVNFGRLAVGELSPMLLVMLRWSGTILLLIMFAGKQVVKDCQYSDGIFYC